MMSMIRTQLSQIPVQHRIILHLMSEISSQEWELVSQWFSMTIPIHIPLIPTIHQLFDIIALWCEWKSAGSTSISEKWGRRLISDRHPTHISAYRIILSHTILYYPIISNLPMDFLRFVPQDPRFRWTPDGCGVTSHPNLAHNNHDNRMHGNVWSMTT